MENICTWVTVLFYVIHVPPSNGGGLPAATLCLGTWEKTCHHPIRMMTGIWKPRGLHCLFPFSLEFCFLKKKCKPLCLPLAAWLLLQPAGGGHKRTTTSSSHLRPTAAPPEIIGQSIPLFPDGDATLLKIKGVRHKHPSKKVSYVSPTLAHGIMKLMASVVCNICSSPFSTPQACFVLPTLAAGQAKAN